MKTLNVSLLLVCLLLGCKTPEDTAYKTTGVTVVTVSAAMNAWHDYVKAGLASEDQVLAVKKAYDKYYTAIQAERAAVIAYKTGADTNALATAMSAVTAAMPDVLTLIFQFLPATDVAKLKGLQ
jgi:hypothetical protein